jgi:hypothetical protein
MSIQEEKTKLQRERSEMGHKIKALHKAEQEAQEIEKQELIDEKIRSETSSMQWN